MGRFGNCHNRHVEAWFPHVADVEFYPCTGTCSQRARHLALRRQNRRKAPGQAKLNSGSVRNVCSIELLAAKFLPEQSRVRRGEVAWCPPARCCRCCVAFAQWLYFVFFRRMICGDAILIERERHRLAEGELVGLREANWSRKHEFLLDVLRNDATARAIGTECGFVTLLGHGVLKSI